MLILRIRAELNSDLQKSTSTKNVFNCRQKVGRLGSDGTVQTVLADCSTSVKR